jgi:hypothetical protein
MAWNVCASVSALRSEHVNMLLHMRATGQEMILAEEQQPKLWIQDNPSVTEVYANKFLGAVFDGGAVALTFGSIRKLPEHMGEGTAQDRQPVVHVTHRLVLSPTATIELINGLKTTLTTLLQMRKQSQSATQQ